MLWRQQQREQQTGSLTRDAELGRLLGALTPEREILPWREVERLVAQAPAVHAGWWAGLTSYGGRQLRYATALMLVLGMSTGVLALMPAHSDNVGTTILTQLPGVWPVDSAAFNEVESAAQQQFEALDIPQSDLFIKVGPGHGRQQLVFSLTGVDQQQAAAYFDALADKFPALQALPVEYTAIDSGRAGNRLNELVLQAFQPALIKPLGRDELRLYLIKSLMDCGFEEIKLDVHQAQDGTTYIEVDARLKVAVTGRTQEELETAGLTEERLGSAGYRLLMQGLPQSQ